MTDKRILLKGTFILTITGFSSRFIGFFYRVFLSHTFGEEGVGLYQLIFPIYALCISLTASGIQTAISRCVAQKNAIHKSDEAKQILLVGLCFSTLLSLISMIIVQTFSATIASSILNDARCENLLIAMSYALPFSSIHSCISGYYFGMKKTGVPAISQLIEQIVRVASVFIIYNIAIMKQMEIHISFAVFGLVLGEIASAIFCLKASAGKSSLYNFKLSRIWKYHTHFKTLLTLSIPLTANRVLLNSLQSVEAISIPSNLLTYGYNTSQALSMYGVLTGMALPCILFPSAITSSISIMLLPTVAEIQATQDNHKLKYLIQKVSRYCFLLGFASCLFFLFLGHPIGTYLFHSQLAGKFIVTLAWICPFLYVNTTLISILNGLGNSAVALIINTLGLILRIGSVFFLIPLYGIQGYLIGLLVSQIVITCACTVQLNHKTQ